MKEPLDHLTKDEEEKLRAMEKCMGLQLSGIEAFLRENPKINDPSQDTQTRPK